MADARVAILAKVPLFSGVSQRHLRGVIKRMYEQEFKEGAHIVREGSYGQSLYVLLEGVAKVVRSGRTLNYLSDGDFFGEVSVLDRRPRMASVVAVSPVRCLVLHRDELKALVEAEPRVAWLLLSELASRVRGE